MDWGDSLDSVWGDSRKVEEIVEGRVVFPDETLGCFVNGLVKRVGGRKGGQSRGRSEECFSKEKINRK